MRIFGYNEFINEKKGVKVLGYNSPTDSFVEYSTPRSVSLDHLYSIKRGEDIEALLNKYAPYFLEPGNISTDTGTSKFLPIYRGVSKNETILLVQPSKSEVTRMSQNTPNYYTLMMDNTWPEQVKSEFGLEYPTRGKSIICSTSPGKAQGYGDVYRVIPLDPSAVIAATSEGDIWVSFDKGLNKYINSELEVLYYNTNYAHGIVKMSDFNSFLRQVFDLDESETYEALEDKITMANLEQFVHNSVWDEDEREEIMTLMARRDLDGDDGLLPFFEKAISLKENPGFNFFKFGDSKKTMFNEARELWTSGDCLLIHASQFNDWLERKFKMPTTDKNGWSIKDGLSTDPSLKTDEERRKRAEESG